MEVISLLNKDVDTIKESLDTVSTKTKETAKFTDNSIHSARQVEGIFRDIVTRVENVSHSTTGTIDKLSSITEDIEMCNANMIRVEEAVKELEQTTEAATIRESC